MNSILRNFSPQNSTSVTAEVEVVSKHSNRFSNNDYTSLHNTRNTQSRDTRQQQQITTSTEVYNDQNAGDDGYMAFQLRRLKSRERKIIEENEQQFLAKADHVGKSKRSVEYLKKMVKKTKESRNQSYESHGLMSSCTNQLRIQTSIQSETERMERISEGRATTRVRDPLEASRPFEVTVNASAQRPPSTNDPEQPKSIILNPVVIDLGNICPPKDDCVSLNQVVIDLAGVCPERVYYKNQNNGKGPGNWPPQPISSKKYRHPDLSRQNKFLTQQSYDQTVYEPLMAHRLSHSLGSPGKISPSFSHRSAMSLARSFVQQNQDTRRQTITRRSNGSNNPSNGRGSNGRPPKSPRPNQLSLGSQQNTTPQPRIIYQQEMVLKQPKVKPYTFQASQSNTSQKKQKIMSPSANNSSTHSRQQSGRISNRMSGRHLPQNLNNLMQKMNNRSGHKLQQNRFPGLIPKSKNSSIPDSSEFAKSASSNSKPSSTNRKQSRAFDQLTERMYGKLTTENTQRSRTGAAQACNAFLHAPIDQKKGRQDINLTIQSSIVNIRKGTNSKNSKNESRLANTKLNFNKQIEDDEDSESNMYETCNIQDQMSISDLVTKSQRQRQRSKVGKSRNQDQQNPGKQSRKAIQKSQSIESYKSKLSQSVHNLKLNIQSSTENVGGKQNGDQSDRNKDDQNAQMSTIKSNDKAISLLQQNLPQILAYNPKTPDCTKFNPQIMSSDASDNNGGALQNYYLSTKKSEQSILEQYEANNQRIETEQFIKGPTSPKIIIVSPKDENYTDNVEKLFKFDEQIIEEQEKENKENQEPANLEKELMKLSQKELQAKNTSLFTQKEIVAQNAPPDYVERELKPLNTSVINGDYSKIASAGQNSSSILGVESKKDNSLVASSTNVYDHYSKKESSQISSSMIQNSMIKNNSSIIAGEKELIGQANSVCARDNSFDLTLHASTSQHISSKFINQSSQLLDENQLNKDLEAVAEEPRSGPWEFKSDFAKRFFQGTNKDLYSSKLLTKQHVYKVNLNNDKLNGLKSPLRYPQSKKCSKSAYSDTKQIDYKYTGTASIHSQKLKEEFKNIKSDNSRISRSISQQSGISKRSEDHGQEKPSLNFMTFDQQQEKLQTLEKKYLETQKQYQALQQITQLNESPILKRNESPILKNRHSQLASNSSKRMNRNNSVTFKFDVTDTQPNIIQMQDMSKLQHSRANSKQSRQSILKSNSEKSLYEPVIQKLNNTSSNFISHQVSRKYLMDSNSCVAQQKEERRGLDKEGFAKNLADQNSQNGYLTLNDCHDSTQNNYPTMHDVTQDQHQGQNTLQSKILDIIPQTIHLHNNRPISTNIPGHTGYPPTVGPTLQISSSNAYSTLRVPEMTSSGTYSTLKVQAGQSQKHLQTDEKQTPHYGRSLEQDEHGNKKDGNARYMNLIEFSSKDCGESSKERQLTSLQQNRDLEDTLDVGGHMRVPKTLIPNLNEPSENQDSQLFHQGFQTSTLAASNMQFGARHNSKDQHRLSWNDNHNPPAELKRLNPNTDTQKSISSMFYNSTQFTNNPVSQKSQKQSNKLGRRTTVGTNQTINTSFNGTQKTAAQSNKTSEKLPPKAPAIPLKGQKIKSGGQVKNILTMKQRKPGIEYGSYASQYGRQTQPPSTKSHSLMNKSQGQNRSISIKKRSSEVSSEQIKQSSLKKGFRTNFDSTNAYNSGQVSQKNSKMMIISDRPVLVSNNRSNSNLYKKQMGPKNQSFRSCCDNTQINKHLGYSIGLTSSGQLAHGGTDSFLKFSIQRGNLKNKKNQSNQQRRTKSKN